MPIGNMLSANEQQYVALRDSATNTWRILDTWHDDIKSLDADSDIPDESPAVAVFSEGQFLALIKEAGRLGVLANASFGTGEAELEAIILDRDKEIQELHEKILKLEEEKSEVVRSTSHTEDYELKEKAMANILKLVSMQDMSNLSKE
tara:strand:- start:183 stop:626 length:444 start_codon:yes stop_codon:yes gene_type:complete